MEEVKKLNKPKHVLQTIRASYTKTAGVAIRLSKIQINKYLAEVLKKFRYGAFKIITKMC